ncbi:DUF402 domain-containing protein [Candidatus Acetothermia bacterium]|nr:DUF402 domain-containing protein [Candidatus Acetothermia bacterium]MBI3660579.1 DUF402 domain-containing protein [Candidatus Acetothermia bacterium]
MNRVRVRGIYSTALTHLLHRRGFSIVQPSRKIQERFQLGPLYEPFDLELKDSECGQGIIAAGPKEALEKLATTFQDDLPDVMTRPVKAPLHSVYWGLVQSLRPSGYLMDLGCDVGFLPHSKASRPLRLGEAILVQVCELAPAGKHLIVTMEISLPGQRAVLSSQGNIRVSREIEELAERERLLRVGRRLLPPGWGVIWRTAAYQCDEPELIAELERLVAHTEHLHDHPEEGIPGLLLGFEATTQFEFPGSAKQRLDQLRGEIVPTLPGHHKYKAAGSFRTVDRAEARLQQYLGDNTDHSNGRMVEFPEVGETLLIEHVKPEGETIILGRGKVMAADSAKKTVQLRREIRGNGSYDGLSALKAPGDFALTEFCEGRWEYRTFYYSNDERCKGIYANVNTPIEIYPDRVRYIDLEIDVTREPEGEVRIIDEAKLHAAMEAGYLREKLAERARQVAAQLKTELSEISSIFPRPAEFMKRPLTDS